MQEIAKNIKLIKNKLLKNQKLCFVAKSNCYGLGSEICSYFNDFVDYFAVSCVYEFEKIKQFTNKNIIILDPIFDKNELIYLIKNNAELTVSNFESLKLIKEVCDENNLNSVVHIAINSGMNRLGFSENNEIIQLIDTIKKSQNIKIKGVFSHYFYANNATIADFQLKKYKYLLSFFENNSIINNENKSRNKLEKLSQNIFYQGKFPITHISASDGVNYKNFGNMARVGFAIFSDDYFETIKLKSKIIDLQELKEGDSAGYKNSFIAKNNCTLAVVSIGYGDGIFRNIKNKGYVLIRGEFAKIVAVCMDMIIVDVTKINCKINDDVIIIGKMGKNAISICDIANWCDTIGYEVIVRLSDRIKRVYLGEKECRLFLENLEQEN